HLPRPGKILAEPAAGRFPAGTRRTAGAAHRRVTTHRRPANPARISLAPAVSAAALPQPHPAHRPQSHLTLLHLFTLSSRAQPSTAKAQSRDNAVAYFFIVEAGLHSREKTGHCQAPSPALAATAKQ